MRQTYLFAAAVAALILACVAGWATSDTQARVATPSVQIDPIQMMESATCVENPQYRLEQATCCLVGPFLPQSLPLFEPPQLPVQECTRSLIDPQHGPGAIVVRCPEQCPRPS
jgi:hypothetical protein